MKAKDIKIRNEGNLLELIPLVDTAEISVRGNIEEGFKAIVNSDGKTIAVQKKTYQLVQHRDVVSELLNNDDFKQKYKIVQATIYKSGCVMMLEIQPLHEQRVELVPGDFLAPSVRVFNSYDSTKALIVESFGMRLICSNGAVAPAGVDRFHKTHTHQNANILELNAQIEKAMETWKVSAGTLQKAYTKVVDVEDTLKLLKNFPEKYRKIVIQNLRRNDTLYNLWNALTNCITYETSVSTSTLVNYQNMVNKIFNVLNDPEVDPVLNEGSPETAENTEQKDSDNKPDENELE